MIAWQRKGLLFRGHYLILTGFRCIQYTMNHAIYPVFSTCFKVFSRPYIDPANGAITNNAKTGRRMVNAAETNNGKKYGYSITPPGGRSSINYSYPEGCGHGGKN